MSESLPLSVVVRPKGPAFLKEFVASAKSTLGQLNGIASSESADGLLIEGLWEPDLERAIDALKGAMTVDLQCTPMKIHFIEGARVLEPILKLTIVVPEDFLGSVFGDLNARRGVIMTAADAPDNSQVIEVQVPLAELIGYQTVLRKLSNGRATVTAELAEYQEAPRPSPADPHGPKAAAMRA
jgi:hypothetical protein